MKKITLSLLLFLGTTMVFGQNNFCLPGVFAYKRFYKGDTIIIQCDTAYLFNKGTFSLYQRLYRNFGTQDQKVKAILSSYDHMKSLYENRISEQEREYNILLAKFDSLAENSQKFNQASLIRLNAVDASLKVANTNILNAKTDLTNAETRLTQEIGNSRKRLLKWGIGGFSLGVAASLLVVVVR
jgi:hypothetical protein